jgi:hypothetical protein
MPAPKKHSDKKDAVGKDSVKRELQLDLKVAYINCPRCHKHFTCNTVDIQQCQCWGVGLEMGDFAYLKQQGFSAEETGCLCRECLLEIQIEVKASVRNS